MIVSTHIPEPEEIRGGHVENTFPPIWFQAEREVLFEPVSQLTGEHAQFGMVRKATYDYLAELKPVSLVEIKTFIRRLGTSSATFSHQAWQNNQLCVEAEIIVVMIDRHKGASIPISIEGKNFLRNL